MRALILPLLAVLLLACGKDSSSPAPSKALFAVWTSNDDGSVLDLTNASFGVGQAYTGLFPGGEICDCQFAVIGTASAGNWTLAACSYRAASGGGADPGCAGLNSNGTYTNASAVLSVCQGGTCETYR